MIEGSILVFGGSESRPAPGKERVQGAVERAVSLAERDKELFGTAEVGGVYALAQCWKSVGERGCRQCLAAAANAVTQTCRGTREGRAFYAGCYLRFSTNKFYGDRRHSGDDGDADVDDVDSKFFF